MIGAARALLLIARYFRRIALTLEEMRDLYRTDLESRGVIGVRIAIEDETEVIYPK